MVVIAIVGFLATFGIIAGLDTYSRYSFNSEVDNVVAMLQKARSEAINNIGGSKHGVCFDPVKCADDIILFAGTTYTPPAFEFEFEKNKTITYSGATEIVFDQLSGNAPACSPTPCTVTITGIKPTNITINNEGGIDY